MLSLEKFSAEELEKIRAKALLAREYIDINIREFDHYPGYRLPIAGATYPGIWLEHIQDTLFLCDYDPEAAWDAIRFFMDRQREDGLIPFMTLIHDESCFWHLQTVWGFARAALETAKKIGRPDEDLKRIYHAGCAYDRYLQMHRDRVGSGLVEMYCEWDTGHDNDRRVTDGGIPQTCPGNDAGNMPDLEVMPILSVDLSAARYGGLDALAELAEILGMAENAAMHRQQAEHLKQKMRELLYDPEDEFYYDRSPQGLRKYRTEHITRVFLNRVCDQEEFDRIYHRYFEDPEEFMTAFPYPSVSVSDPSFDRNCPQNSWGSNSQSMTSLRAMLWLEHYGRMDEKKALLLRWVRAFLNEENIFGQEIVPFTGLPPEGPVVRRGYMPAVLLFLLGAKELGIELPDAAGKAPQAEKCRQA